MLEGLNDVNWDNLRSAYGSSSEIPYWIRNLTSRELEVREHSISQLREYINHQNTITEVTIVSIHFLAELLANDEILDKSQIVALLIDIVRSYFLTLDTFLETKRPNTLLFNYPTQLYMYLDAIRAIANRVEIYRRLLRVENIVLKIVTVQLLGILGDFAPEWAIEELAYLARYTTDVGLKAEAIWGIGLIVSSSYIYPIQPNYILEQKIPFSPEAILKYLSSSSESLVQLAVVSVYVLINKSNLIFSQQIILEYLDVLCDSYLNHLPDTLLAKSKYLEWIDANRITGFDEILPWAFTSRAAITKTISRLGISEVKLKSLLDRLPASKNKLEKLIIES
jgi:hypothetical protein